MKDLNRNLMIQQLDKRISEFSTLNNSTVPSQGWIKSIRVSLNMTLTQLAKKLKKSPPTVKEIEERELNKSITLKKLMEVGEVLNLKFIYGFVPEEGTLEALIEKRAFEIAKQIVLKTSHSMKLEDQEISDERLKKAITERAAKIKQEMPKYLWD